MMVQESWEGGTRILHLSGRLDNVAAAAAESAMSAETAASKALVIDLSELAYISSAGLRILLKMAKQAQSAGRPFAIAGLQPPVKELFGVTGFDTIITVYGSRAEALSKLG